MLSNQRSYSWLFCMRWHIQSSYWLTWSHQFESFTFVTMTWLTVMEYLCHKWLRICSICRKHFPHSWLITGFVTNLTRRVPLVKLELLTLPEHPSSPLVVSGVGVTQSLVLFVGFVLLSFLLLAIVLSALRFMDSDYPFGIFKLFLYELTFSCQLLHQCIYTYNHVIVFYQIVFLLQDYIFSY